MPGTKSSGNRTTRRGSRPRQRLTLSKSGALTLRTLLAHRNSWRDEPMTEEQLVEELLEAAWRELDAEYEAAAEEAAIYGD